MILKKARARLLVAALIALALIGVPSIAFSEMSGGSSQNEVTEFSRDLDKARTKFQFGKFIPGAIGMIRNGDNTEFAQTGYGDFWARIPADPQAKFRIGSNTKTITATVVLQLVAEGKLSLDDTVSQYFPDLVNKNGNDGTKITIRQLLNHTSGLPEHTDDLGTSLEYFLDLNPHKKWDPRTLVEMAVKQKAKFAPGEGTAYSNTGYVLLGMIVESVTGKSIATEMQERIFAPLGMSNTRLPVGDPTLKGNWLHGYVFIRDISFSNVDLYGASGSVVSTLDDYSTFVRALLSGGLLPPEQLKEMQTTTNSDKLGDYGLGIRKMETSCGTAYAHGGAVLGYRSQWFSTPDGERQVLYAINEYHMIGDGASKHFYDAGMKAFCAGQDTQTSEEGSAVSPEENPAVKEFNTVEE